MSQRIPKKAPDSVRQWYRKLYAYVKSEYFPVQSQTRRETLTKLAGYLALVGTPDDENAQSLFWALCLLYVHKNRTKRWPATTDEIPADRDKLIAFARLVERYEKICSEGHADSLSTGKINLERTVHYAFKVLGKDEAFFDAIKSSWRSWPSDFFSESFFREAARTNKGAFGDFSENEYGLQLDSVEEIE